LQRLENCISLSSYCGVSGGGAQGCHSNNLPTLSTITATSRGGAYASRLRIALFIYSSPTNSKYGGGTLNNCCLSHRPQVAVQFHQQSLSSTMVNGNSRLNQFLLASSGKNIYAPLAPIWTAIRASWRDGDVGAYNSIAGLRSCLRVAQQYCCRWNGFRLTILIPDGDVVIQSAGMARRNKSHQAASVLQMFAPHPSEQRLRRDCELAKRDQPDLTLVQRSIDLTVNRVFHRTKQYRRSGRHHVLHRHHGDQC